MSKEFDLTEGKILTKLMVIAWPMMAAQLFQMLYNFIDMFLLGRISGEAVAATGSAGMYLWLSMAFVLVGSMGAEIGVSQSLGRKEEEAAKRYSQSAILIALVLGLLCMIAVQLFSHQLIGVLQIQEAHVALNAANYLRIVSLGFPLTFMNFAINGAYNGAGNSRFPFYIKALGLGLNIILSPLFIFVFDLGVIGAATATVIAQSFISLVFLYTMKYHKARPFPEFFYRDIFRIDTAYIKQIFKWALPISIESLCFTLLTMFISRMIAEFGAGALATFSVGVQIESITWLVGGGFAAALTAFVGQNFGANKWDRIHEGFKMSLYIMGIYGSIISVLMFFGARPLFSLFITEPDIIELGVDYLRIAAAVQLMACLEPIAAGAFRGIGKTQPPSIVSITFNFLRVIFAFFLSQTALGLNGIWIGMVLGNTFRGLVLMGWYLLYSRRQKTNNSFPRLEKSL